MGEGGRGAGSKTKAQGHLNASRTDKKRGSQEAKWERAVMLSAVRHDVISSPSCYQQSVMFSAVRGGTRCLGPGPAKDSEWAGSSPKC